MDIVERLRDEASMYDADDVDLHLDAVTEIERLREELKFADEIRQSALQSLFGAEKEIERLRKALQLIAAPSKVVVKGEEAVVALRLLLSSHRRTALKALGGGD